MAAALTRIWEMALWKMDNVLVVKYEDMHKDLFHQVKRILKFLRIKTNDIKIKKALFFSNIEKMREMEMEGKFKKRYGGKLTPGDINDPESFKVRKGKVGGYKDYLKEKDLEYCNRIIDKSKNNFYKL